MKLITSETSLSYSNMDFNGNYNHYAIRERIWNAKQLDKKRSERLLIEKLPSVMSGGWSRRSQRHVNYQHRAFRPFPFRCYWAVKPDLNRLNDEARRRRIFYFIPKFLLISFWRFFSRLNLTLCAHLVPHETSFTSIEYLRRGQLQINSID